MQLYKKPGDSMSPFWVAKLEKDAARNWDKCALRVQ